MLQVRLTASQLAERADMPRGSVNFYVNSGLLQPSSQRGRGKGYPNVFGFTDLIIALAISKMRLPNISVEGMQKIANFWRAHDESSLRGIIHANADANAKKEDVDAGQVLLLLDNGQLVIEQNLRILEVTEKYGSAVVHVVDVGRLANAAFVNLTEDRLGEVLIQPGPSGRLPRRPRPAKASPIVPENTPKPRRDGERAARREGLRGEVRRKKSGKKESKSR